MCPAPPSRPYSQSARRSGCRAEDEENGKEVSAELPKHSKLQATRPVQHAGYQSASSSTTIKINLVKTSCFWKPVDNQRPARQNSDVP